MGSSEGSRATSILRWGNSESLNFLPWRLVSLLFSARDIFLRAVLRDGAAGRLTFFGTDFVKISSKYNLNKTFFLYTFFYISCESGKWWVMHLLNIDVHIHTLSAPCVWNQNKIPSSFHFPQKTKVWCERLKHIHSDPGNISSLMGFEGFTQVQAHPPGVLVIRPEFPGHPRHIHCQPSPALGRETQPGCYFHQILRLLALSEDLVFIAV